MTENTTGFSLAPEIGEILRKWYEEIDRAYHAAACYIAYHPSDLAQKELQRGCDTKDAVLRVVESAIAGDRISKDDALATIGGLLAIEISEKADLRIIEATPKFKKQDTRIKKKTKRIRELTLLIEILSMKVKWESI